MTKSDLYKTVLSLMKEFPKTQVEPYEGQFEDIEEFIIKPPALFIDVTKGGNSQELSGSSDLKVALYVCTTNLQAKSQTPAMLDLIDSIEEKFINTHLIPLYKYHGFHKIGNYPGFKLYQLNYTVSG